MKIVAMMLALAISTNVMAADVRVGFSDGKEVIFQNLPNDVTRDQMDSYIHRYTQYTANQAVYMEGLPKEKKSANNDIATGLAMVAVGGALLYALSKSDRKRSPSGSCDYEWQVAKDGSRCGGRAASARPGGR